jgi:cytochrome c5
MTEGFQSPGSPLAMPSRGGDPGLSDADLKAVLEYMRKEFKIAP